MLACPLDMYFSKKEQETLGNLIQTTIFFCFICFIQFLTTYPVHINTKIQHEFFPLSSILFAVLTCLHTCNCIHVQQCDESAKQNGL